MFPADLAKRRRQNNIKNYNNIHVHNYVGARNVGAHVLRCARNSIVQNADAGDS